VTATIATAAGETLTFERRQMTITGSRSADDHLRANRSGLWHDLVFTSRLTASTRAIVAPGASDRIAIPGIDPGTNRFACTIHDGMAGTLVVLAG